MTESSLDRQRRDVEDPPAMAPPGDGPEVMATGAVEGCLGPVSFGLGYCGGERRRLVVAPARAVCFGRLSQRPSTVCPTSLLHGVWGMPSVEELRRDRVYALVKLYGRVDKGFNVSDHRMGATSEASHPVLLEPVFQLEAW